MKLGRREFVGIIGASMVSLSAPGLGGAETAAGAVQTLKKNGWRVKVAANGEIVSFSDGKLELVNQQLPGNRPRVVIGRTRVCSCDQPAASRQNAGTLIFEYRFADPEAFGVVYEIGLIDLPQGSVALRQKVSIQSPGKIAEGIRLEVPRNIQLPFENRKVFLPLKNGIGRQKPIEGYENEDEYVFSFAGGYVSKGRKPQHLAIPMVDEYADATDLHLTFSTDPFFSSYLFLPVRNKIGQFNCVYSGEVGLQGTEERTLDTGLHRGDGKTSMEVFYATALQDVEPGPDWLHGIAMVDYDYLSKNGKGWFADIDALTRLVSPEDRGKIFLALHGWYDWVGRYTFDDHTHALDKQWTAFPSARDFRARALRNPLSAEYGWRKSLLETLRPVPMSIEDMHRRIRYAKERGFRVGIYYADGVNACDGLRDIYDPQKVLRWGGWTGPDTIGRAYAQNPLHPGVRAFYRDYIKALLDEYGRDVDGFIWDETFTVHAHELGPAPYTGYADRAMMTLVQEVAAAVADFSPQLAFLTSDDIGASYAFDDNAPYSLVAHGTYQDSGCATPAWSYGLLPNFRNVLWSCNWAPVTRFFFTRYGVETFGTPVAISNGYGDDTGISDMSPADRKRTMDLFHSRKERRMNIGWVEEAPWNPTYQGKKIGFKWDL